MHIIVTFLTLFDSLKQKDNCLVSLLLLWMELEKRINIKYLLFLCQCATFVGTVTYMSPERIRNETYSFAADIWSLGLTILECGSGKFPYSANEGPANLMLQVSSISFSLFCCIFPHAYHLSNYFFLCYFHFVHINTNANYIKLNNNLYNYEILNQNLKIILVLKFI